MWFGGGCWSSQGKQQAIFLLGEVLVVGSVLFLDVKGQLTPVLAVVAPEKKADLFKGQNFAGNENLRSIFEIAARDIVGFQKGSVYEDTNVDIVLTMRQGSPYVGYLYKDHFESSSFLV